MDKKKKKKIIIDVNKDYSTQLIGNINNEELLMSVLSIAKILLLDANYEQADILKDIIIDNIDFITSKNTQLYVCTNGKKNTTTNTKKNNLKIIK